MDHVSLGRLHWSAPPHQLSRVEISSARLERVKVKCEFQDRSKVKSVQGRRGHRWACEEGALTAAPNHMSTTVCRNGPAPRRGVNLHWLTTSPFYFLKKEKEKEKQLACWKPEAVSQMLPGNQRNPGHDGMWGRLGFIRRQRAEHKVFCKIKPCHSAAEDPAPLSYGAKWIYQTQHQGLS